MSKLVIYTLCPMEKWHLENDKRYSQGYY